MPGALLEEWGFRTEYHEYAESADQRNRAARRLERQGAAGLTGHLDVVPLGSRKWSREPFAGEADGDKLYGRGVSDMKAGVAAILLAARSFSRSWPARPASSSC